MNPLHKFSRRRLAPSRFDGRHRRFMHACVAGATLALTHGAGAAAADGVLTVHATGFAHARGHAVAKLFAPGDKVTGEGRWQQVAPIESAAAVFRFEGLPAGSYAVVVFHDENDNGVIDHGLLGPSEPLGFSGGFVLSVFSGRPDFDSLKFDFQPPTQRLGVRLR